VRRPLLLVGASGLGRETAEAVRAGEEWDLEGWVDDDPTLWGTELDGLPVLGPPELLVEHDDWSAVLCPGSGRARSKVADRLADLALGRERFGSVVHPTAVVPRSCTVGAGSILLAGTVLTASVEVGRHVVVMPGSVLTHDDVLADHVTVCARVALAGGVVVAEGAYLGTGCTVRENRHLGAWSTIGMGSVVLQDVPPQEVWVGVPARRLREAQQDVTSSGPVAVGEGNRT
jgi:sugar O-acyltransferase (sialic acid O-acetyltransferase NeuD family)